MLRNENGTCRFSEQVESELKKIGVHITKVIKKDNCLYTNDSGTMYVFSYELYPTVLIDVTIDEFRPSLVDFINKIDSLKTLAIRIHDIVMKDYPDYQEENHHDQI